MCRQGAPFQAFLPCLVAAAISQVVPLSQAWIAECRNKALDCFEEDAAGPRSRFVVWPPFAIAMTHALRLSKKSLDEAEGFAICMCLESFQEFVARHVHLKLGDISKAMGFSK